MGKLDSRAANALEEQYFPDQSFFREMQAAEVALILDYLDGRLDLADKELFEKRYLKVPELVQRVEKVRAARSTPAPARRAASVWFRPALAAVCCALVAIMVWYWWRSLSPPAVQTARTLTNPPAIPLLLSPGVEMGGGVKSVVLHLPHAARSVRLTLELPGLLEPADFTVQVSSIGPPSSEIWTSPSTLHSIPAAGGQVLTAELRSSLLGPGDYLVSVKDSTGSIRERYLFRADSDQ